VYLADRLRYKYGSPPMCGIALANEAFRRRSGKSRSRYNIYPCKVEIKCKNTEVEKGEWVCKYFKVQSKIFFYYF